MVTNCTKWHSNTGIQNLEGKKLVGFLKFFFYLSFFEIWWIKNDFKKVVQSK